MATNKFTKIIVLIFVFAGILQVGISSYIWLIDLEPKLTTTDHNLKIIINKQSAMPFAIADILEPQSGDIQTDQVINAMKMLLHLKDPGETENLLMGIKLDVDYTVVKARKGELDLEIGRTTGNDIFGVELPIFSRTTKELLCIVTFYLRDITKSVRGDLRLSFLSGIAISLSVIVVSLIIITVLFRKKSEAEKAIQEEQAKLAHAGRLASMGEMATAIAHEISQPLSIIYVTAERLIWHFNNKAPDIDEAEDAREIFTQVERADAIIKNMRSFLRAKDNLVWVDPAEPVVRAVSFFKEQFRLHGIRLSVSLETDLPEMEINSQKMEQVVVNFLSNARRAVEEKGENTAEGYLKEVNVTLFHDKRNHVVVLEVKDNGIGMSLEVKDRCIEPFFTTEEIGEGMGLGLYIVHGIVRELRMSMRIDSVVNEGSIFRVLMPIGGAE